MVKAAYSWENRLIGVGAVLVTPVLNESCRYENGGPLIMSKSFDNGMICASEQSVIVPEKMYEDVKKNSYIKEHMFLNAEKQIK